MVSCHLQRQPDRTAVCQVTAVPSVSHIDELACLSIHRQHPGYLRIKTFAGIILSRIPHFLPSGEQVLAPVVNMGRTVPAVCAAGDQIIPPVKFKYSRGLAAVI